MESRRDRFFGLSDAKRRSIRWWVFGGMTALMLGGVALGFVPFFVASYQVKALCESLPVGSKPEEVKSLAQVSGYQVSTESDGRVLIKVPALASRLDSQRGCLLRFGPQGLVSAKFGAAM